MQLTALALGVVIILSLNCFRTSSVGEFLPNYVSSIVQWTKRAVLPQIFSDFYRTFFKKSFKCWHPVITHPSPFSNPSWIPWAERVPRFPKSKKHNTDRKIPFFFLLSTNGLGSPAKNDVSHSVNMPMKRKRENIFLFFLNHCVK